jgi:hypothetical protein
MTQFGVFKAQVADLTQHGAPVAVSVGVPARRQGIHFEKPECGLQRTALGHEADALHIRVARAKHRGKPRGLFLAPPQFTRLFEMPMIADNLQGAFTIDFLFQPPQHPFYRLAFFKFYLGQNTLTSSPETLDTPGQHGRRSSLSQAKKNIFRAIFVNRKPGRFVSYWPALSGKVIDKAALPAKVNL